MTFPEARSSAGRRGFLCYSNMANDDAIAKLNLGGEVGRLGWDMGTFFVMRPSMK